MKKPFTSLHSLACAILVLIAGIFGSYSATASHLVGGEITYQWIAGNQYSVKLTLYRDCAGIPASQSATVMYNSASCSQTGSVTLSLTGTPIMVTPVCTASLPQASCNGGQLYSVQKQTYQGMVTLPGNCNDWTFSWSECCRNGSITNLQLPGAMSMYLSARLNNLDVPFNNSVKFGSDPVNVIYNNVTTNLDWNTYDLDGDSLVYELVAAQNSNGVSVAYAPGYTYQQPINSSSNTILGPNGILTVSPAMLQIAVISMRISEYRMGVLIGQVYRDFQIAVVNGSNNPPALTGINGTNNFSINGCPGDTIQFDVLSSDTDPGQSLTLTMSPNNTLAGFSTSAGPYPTGSFSWVPQVTDISSQPYVFTVEVQDDYCPYYGTQTYAYQVYVNGCNTNDVWPGDANSDGTANLYDLLAIGLAFNDNGPVRPSASLAWVAQACPNWTNSFSSGINHKHADTDGNGVVNMADTTAILLNYGLNHPLRNGNPVSLNSADLIVTSNVDTTGTSALVTFDIALSQVDSIYGLAFRMYFDPSLTDAGTISISYPNSIFGTNGIDMLKLNKTIALTGFADIALTRLNMQNLTGQGPVARITIVTTDNVSGKVTMNVTPFDVVGITASGSGVTVNPVGDDLVIDPAFVGLNDPALSAQLTVHPVPARDYINFNYHGSSTINAISIVDVTGKVILKVINPENKGTVNVQSLSKGIYSLQTEINNITIYKTIVIL